MSEPTPADHSEDTVALLLDAERYRWLRDECRYMRQCYIIDAAEGIADLLDHHIDKARCGL